MKILALGFSNQYISFYRSENNIFFGALNMSNFVPMKPTWRKALLFCFRLKKSTAESLQKCPKIVEIILYQFQLMRTDRDDSKVEILIWKPRNALANQKV